MNIQSVGRKIVAKASPIINEAATKAKNAKGFVGNIIPQKAHKPIAIAGISAASYGIILQSGLPETVAHKAFAKNSKEGDIILPSLKEDINEVQIQTKDGIDLNVWDINPTNSNKYAIFFHGINTSKAGLDYQNLYKELTDKGIGVLAMEYRGYGDSDDKISEKGFMLDAQAGYNYLIDKGIEPNNIGAVGHSLGGAVACKLASANDLGFLVLNSTFDNAKSAVKNIKQSQYLKDNTNILTKAIVAMTPTGAIKLNNEFKTDEYIENVTCPTYVMHCEKDELFDVELAQNIVDKNENSDIKIFPNSSAHYITEAESADIADYADFIFSN